MDADKAHRQELRARLVAQREQLPAPARIAAATALAELLSTHPVMESSGYVAGYWAVRGELLLHMLLSHPRAGFTYCLPLLEADKRLSFAPWRFGDALLHNRYGIPEPDVPPASRLQPAQLDAVLVPLVGFDRRGNRLGSGAGYYDRSFAFLQECKRPSRPLLIGVGYAFQEVEALPAQPWDVPLDLVATDRELIACG
jgi:5-formyltetrahydrofolate cyclo-ligase